MEIWHALLDILFLLLGALIIGALLERARQSAVVGFILAGMILGPHGLDVVESTDEVKLLAELGVSFLLFGIGLEFSRSKLARLRSASVLGVLQVIATAGLATAGCAAFGLDWRASVGLGLIVALSSTACVLRVLTDRAQLDSGPGRNALGVLLVQDVAVKAPLRLITELLGVPREDEWRILQLTNELFAGDDPEMQRMADDPLSIFDTIKDIYQYFSDLTDKLRAEPEENLASYIANGRINGEYMPYKELISYYTIVATAGHDTTRNSISGGLHALLTHPEQLKLLQETAGDEEALKLAVEEMLRWTTPVVQFSRTAEQDYELRGKTIRQGDTVGLMYASASFDEDIFDDPFKFDITRKPNRHLAFGTGPHQCLGLILARLEMRLLFQQLVPRIAEMEVMGAPERIRASFVHGLKHMPIRYRLTT